MKLGLKKFIIKVGLVAIGLGMALLLVNSCMKPEPILTVTAPPNAGHPPFQTTITTACSIEGGAFTLSEQGKQPVSSTEGTFNVLIEGWPYKATIEWTDGNNVAESAVKLALINKRPVAHDLALSPGTLQEGQGVWIDLRYLEQGCINGAVMRHSGMEDPDYTGTGYSMENDGFTYHVEIYDESTGRQETVYKADGTVLGRNEYSADPFFKWFIGWSQAIPPYPFQPKDVKCTPTPVLPDPTPDPDHRKLIHVYVKEWGTAYHWVYTVETTGGGCSAQ